MKKLTLLAIILVVLASCATTKYTTKFRITYGERNYYVDEYRVDRGTIFFTEYKRGGKNVRGEYFAPVDSVKVVDSNKNTIIVK